MIAFDTDLLVNGYKVFEDKKILFTLGKIPDIKEWEGDQVKSPKGFDLRLAQNYINNKYVAPVFGGAVFGYSNIWSGTDSNSKEWHNDLIEGCNLFFMYYLSDITEGGELCFRVNGKETGSIQPKKDMLVMGSQERYVEHKVNDCNQERIVCNFGYNI